MLDYFLSLFIEALSDLATGFALLLIGFVRLFASVLPIVASLIIFSYLYKFIGG